MKTLIESQLNVNDVSKLLGFQYKLIVALNNRSLDVLSKKERKLCAYTHEITKRECIHGMIGLFLTGFFSEHQESIIETTRELTYNQFDEAFEKIDELVNSAYLEVIEYHHHELLMQKQKATKHTF